MTKNHGSSARFLMAIGAAVLTAAMLAATLFLSAGQWRLPVYQAYIGIYAILAFATMLGIDRELIRERHRPGPGGRDRSFPPIGNLLMWIHLVIAGMDIGRYHWSDTVPQQARVVGLVLLGLAFGFAVWGVTANRFFSPVVRIQDERGHQVITTGPYGLVRHPGYAGFFVGLVGSVLALGSWLAGVPVAAFLVLILRRTIIEDRFLQENLDGYSDYAQNVRYRLVPGIW